MICLNSFFAVALVRRFDRLKPARAVQQQTGQCPRGTVKAIGIAHRVAVAILTLMTIGFQSAQAGTTTLTATEEGSFSNSGKHLAASTNYAVGQGTYQGIPFGVYHDFFAFDIPPIGSIMSASLVVYNPSTGYASANPSETVVLHDVSTPVSTLAASFPGESLGGMAVYDDLGSGVVFASRTVSAADNNSNVVFALNDAAIASLIASLGQPWAIGGAISPITLPPAQNENVFGFSGSVGAQLILQTVPEPSTFVLAAFGILGLVAWRWRRRST